MTPPKTQSPQRSRPLLTGRLSRRIYLAFLLAAAIPTAVAGAVGIYFSLATLKAETLRNLQQEVGLRAEGISRFFDQLRAELAYLAVSQPLLGFLAALDNNHMDLSTARLTLERDFANLAAWYPHIYQIRFLTRDGHERVRVNRIGDQVEVIPEGRLQDKSDRYYFVEAMGRKAGGIYVSPLDLNVEFGQVEMPDRPVIRVGILVGEGAASGLLILNLHADLLLSQVQGMADARDGEAYLIDHSGHFLARTPGDPNQGFSRQPLQLLGYRYGTAAMAELLEQRAPVVQTEHHILSQSAIRLPGETIDSSGWALALAFPQTRLFEALFNLSLLYAVLLSGLAVIAGGGYALSRHLLGPLDALSRETEAIAAGNFTHRVAISGRDEIADLGRRFNSMATRLEVLYDNLERQRAHLAKQVKARTRDLERERAFLAAVVQQSADAILAVDQAGEVTLANDAASALLGYPPIPGHPLASTWPQWPILAEQTRSAGRAQRRDLQIGERVLALALTPLWESGGLVIVARDVSEERRLQDERRELDRQLFQTEKMTTLGELAMGIAHEIGNPLAGMKAVAQAMQYEEDIPHGLLEGLRRLEREIDRLAAFLRSFHGFAAPQATRPQGCDLAALINDLLFWVRKEMKGRGIALVVEAQQLPPILADPNTLRQLLLNLVINAIHAMPGGGTLTLVAAVRVNRMGIEIRDTGPGIPPEVLPHVFDPFYTTRPDGTGLGLAVARKIARAHGASIKAANGPEGGARFLLDWPLA